MIRVNRHSTPQQIWQPLKRAHDREALVAHSSPSLIRTPKLSTQNLNGSMDMTVVETLPPNSNI